jgi:hypothetical protein
MKFLVYSHNSYTAMPPRTRIRKSNFTPLDLHYMGVKIKSMDQDPMRVEFIFDYKHSAISWWGVYDDGDINLVFEPAEFEGFEDLFQNLQVYHQLVNQLEIEPDRHGDDWMASLPMEHIIYAQEALLFENLMGSDYEAAHRHQAMYRYLQMFRWLNQKGLITAEGCDKAYEHTPWSFHQDFLMSEVQANEAYSTEYYVSWFSNDLINKAFKDSLGGLREVSDGLSIWNVTRLIYAYCLEQGMPYAKHP